MTRAGLLLDPSIDQVERTAKGIGPFPEALVGWTSRGFLDGKQPLCLSDEAGARFFYYARPSDTAWRTAPDWVLGAVRYNEAVDAIVAALEPALAGAK